MYGSLPTATTADLVSLVWILVCGFLVLFMQVGFTMVTVGFARARNSGQVALLNMVAFAVSSVAYYLVGFGIQFGGVAPRMTNSPLAHLGGLSALNVELGGAHLGFAGARGFGLAHCGPGALALFFFQLMFLQTAAYIPVGGIMERFRSSTFIPLAAFMAAILFPLVGNWCWGGGFLSSLGVTLGLGHGFIDFAGSMVVHATGGYAALALILVIGPRLGKYNREGQPIAFPAHNLPLVVLGSLLLLFGWMGFNCGSTLSAADGAIPRIAVNTVMAASAACLSAVGYLWKRYGKPDIGIAASGLLAGAVAITAGCAFVEPWAALIIGLVAGVLVCVCIDALEWKARIDDPASVIAIHGICGTWGVLGVGLFADGRYGSGWNGVPGAVRGLFYGDPSQFIAQLFGCCIHFIFVVGATYGFALLLKRVMPLRPTGRQETDGLDLGECGGIAYADFSSVALNTLGFRR